MRVVVINERATPPMRQKRVIRDYRTVLALHPTFVLWLELTKWLRYVTALKRIFAAEDGWVHHFTSRRNVISVDRNAWGLDVSGERWITIEKRSHLLTRGRKWIPQPNRRTNVLIVQNVVSKAIIALVNSHFSNGKRNRRFSLRSREARARLWARQHAETAGIVGDLVRRKVSVIGGGDLNDLNPMKFHPDQRWVKQVGVMHLYTIEAPGGSKLNVRGVTVVREDELETDHAAIMADVVATAPRNGRD